MNSDQLYKLIDKEALIIQKTMESDQHYKIIDREIWRLDAKISSRFSFTKNILKYCKLIRDIESDDNCLAENKHSSAKGAYQFTDDALKTAYNRLGRYAKIKERIPILQLYENAQTALFLADMFQRVGTDEYLIKIGNDYDMIAGAKLYAYFHHTDPDSATKDRMMKFGLPVDFL